MGVGKTSSLLSLVMALKDQKSLTVLGHLSSVFTQLASLFYREPEEVQHALHQAAAAFYAHKLDQLGFESQSTDSEETHKVRMAVRLPPLLPTQRLTFHLSASAEQQCQVRPRRLP